MSSHSPTFPSLHLRQNSFSNPSIALPTWQLILQPFHCFTYVTVHSPILLSLLLCYKIILQPFRRFTYVTAHSPTLVSLLLRQGSSHTSSGEQPMIYRVSLNSQYRFWGLVVGTTIVNLYIGTHVRKHTASSPQTKYHNITCWTLPLLLLTVRCFSSGSTLVALSHCYKCSFHLN